MSEAKIAEIQLSVDLSESTEENELKNTLSQLSGENRGAEYQIVTDWLPNSSVDNTNQSQLNVTDADPNACASVQQTPMGIFVSDNPVGVNTLNANSISIPLDPTHLFQQQSSAALIGLSGSVVTLGFNNPALVLPPFDIPRVNPRIFVESCESSPVQAVHLHVLPFLQPITTVNTVTPQRFFALIITHSAFATHIFANLSSCLNPSPRVMHQSIANSQAFTLPVVAQGKVGETSEPVVPVESRGTVFFCNPSFQTVQCSLGTITTSPQQNPLNVSTLPFGPTMGYSAPVTPASLTSQDLAQPLASSRKNHLP